MQRQLRRVERSEELAAVDAGHIVLEGADEPEPIGWVVGLDVHDGGAVIGQRLRGDRADADPGEVGELDALERELPWPGGPCASARRDGPDARRHELSQYVLGVFAHIRRRSRPPDRCARRLRERAGRAQRAPVGERKVVPIVAHGEVLERHHVRSGVHRRDGHVAGDAAFEQLGLGVHPGEIGDGAANLVERVRDGLTRQQAPLVRIPVLCFGPPEGHGP